MREQGIASPAALEGERQFEAALRPTKLADFTGQPKLKENLAIAIEAAKQRGEAMDHVLLYGPPGLGKTTLATIIAAELGVGFEQTSGPDSAEETRSHRHAHQHPRRARSSSSTKFTACFPTSKKSSTPRWKISAWTS